MKKLLQNRQFIIYLALGVFFSLFLSVVNLFSQCSNPLFPNYDGKNEAYITSGPTFGSPTNPLPWNLSQGRWSACKRESKYFKDYRYPPYFVPAANQNNIYLEIQKGHHLEVDVFRVGNQITLVVCGFLKIGSFEPPELEVVIYKKAIKLNGIPMDPVFFNSVNDIITYQIEVSNLSPVKITNLQINDELTGFSQFLEDLNPSSTITYYADYLVKEEDMSKGFIENEATVQWEASIGGISEAIASEIVYGGMTLVKTPSQQFYSNVGDVISYSLLVYNNSGGDIFLSNVEDSDANFIDNYQGVIPTGGSASFPRGEDEISYTITIDDLNNGMYTNTAVANGNIGIDASGEPIGAEGSATVFFQPLSIVKVADKESYSYIGETITYTITVTNISNVQVKNVVLIDPLTNIDESVEFLNANASFSVTAEYVVSQEDLDSPQILNVARAYGETILGFPFAPSEGFCIVENVNNKNLQKINEPLDMGFFTGKADPQYNTFFNQITVYVCEDGVLIADNIQAMNNVTIVNEGTFIFNYVGGQRANLCIRGEGVYLDHNLDPIISVDGYGNYIVHQPGLLQDYSNWTTGPNCDIPLPIELLSFTPQIKPDRIDLLWTTGTEINNDYFTLERSRDLYGWDILGFVPGAGNSSVPLSYSFSDMQPLDGLAYYRLKQTDFDGKFEYFGPIAAHYDFGLEGLEFKVIKQFSNWIIAVPNDGQYQVEVYSLTGRRLVSEKTENTLTIPAPEGGVVIRVTDGYARSASRVVM
jgi:uncharacterized repeat protein (TIGR01451 family)